MHFVVWIMTIQMIIPLILENFMTNVASNSPAAKAETSHRDEASRAQRDRCEVEQVLGAGSHAANPMIACTLSKTVVFSKPFLLKGVDRILPAGDYRVVTDEELIEGLSFPAYRRVATMIFLPAQSHRASSIEMVTIDPLDLQAV